MQYVCVCVCVYMCVTTALLGFDLVWIYNLNSGYVGMFFSI